MRTLLRLLAATTVSFTLSPAVAATAVTPAAPTRTPEAPALAPHAAPQTLLVQLDTTPGPAGRRLVHYLVFQRTSPSAVATESVVSAAAAGDAGSTAPAVSDRLTSAGWEQVCTLVIEENPGPATAVRAAAAAPANASSTTAASATPVSLAITCPRGNPVSGRSLVVDVALPGAGPARLEMLDVMGRVITERDLGSMGAGRHAVDLSAQARFAPGVYMLRVTQGGDARVARVTVID